MRLLRNTLINLMLSAAILFPLSGCAPTFFKYRYVSLVSVEGIEVVEYGKLAKDGLFFHEEMPVIYLLNRGSYDLSFEVDKNSRGAGMKVSVMSSLDVSLSLQGNAMASESGGVAFERYVELPENALEFAPSLEFMFGGRDSYTAVFDVHEEGRGLIARESIEFTLETNGFYVVMDAI